MITTMPDIALQKPAIIVPRNTNWKRSKRGSAFVVKMLRMIRNGAATIRRESAAKVESFGPRVRRWKFGNLFVVSCYSRAAEPCDGEADQQREHHLQAFRRHRSAAFLRRPNGVMPRAGLARHRILNVWLIADGKSGSGDFCMAFAYSAHQPQSRHRKRRSHNPLFAPVLALAAAIGLAICFVAYVLWPRWPDVPVALDAPALPIVVAGTSFSIEASRDPHARAAPSRYNFFII